MTVLGPGRGPHGPVPVDPVRPQPLHVPVGRAVPDLLALLACRRSKGPPSSGVTALPGASGHDDHIHQHRVGIWAQLVRSRPAACRGLWIGWMPRVWCSVTGPGVTAAAERCATDAGLGRLRHAGLTLLASVHRLPGRGSGLVSYRRAPLVETAAEPKKTWTVRDGKRLSVTSRRDGSAQGVRARRPADPVRARSPGTAGTDN